MNQAVGELADKLYVLSWKTDSSNMQMKQKLKRQIPP